MKVTYEFDPYEDREDLETFQQANKLQSLVFEFGFNSKRRKADLEGEKLEGYELAMSNFFEIAEEEGVVLG